MYKNKQVNILVPIFNQYKLIPDFLEALKNSSVVPDNVVYFDNGRMLADFFSSYPDPELEVVPFQINVLTTEKNRGTAVAWNAMIRLFPEERIILNDDIFVHQDTIKNLIDTEGDIVACDKMAGINVFSCFLIRDSCIKKVGYFDEWISPNYCYFEDNDYVYRMKLLGLEVVRADCGADHYGGGSQTIKALSDSRMKEHHFRFNFAKSRYIEKWGGEPYEEKYTKPFNKE